MKLTSSQVVKLQRRLNEEYDTIIADEKESRSFIAAIQENLEEARPLYDFAATQKKLDALDRRIRTVKHAVNVFNTTHKVPDFNMTIDEVLVYLPQLTRKKEKLLKMSRRLEKQRIDSGYGSSSSNIEYDYANYSVQAAKDLLSEVSETLSRLQTALDIVNNQETMEIEL
ncbi:MAG: hypothetical protein IJ074_04120 [Clostridia bacterium]|nr:hypothetical protein [Clostridia bacterium]